MFENYANIKKNLAVSKVKDGAIHYVFFDVDETIINLKSMFDFLRYYYCQCFGVLNLFGFVRYYLISYRFKRLFKKGKSREYINSAYYRIYKGKSETLLKSYGRGWFDFCLRKRGLNLFNNHVLKELNEHKNNGACIVLVSGSFDVCLQPIADHIGADHILASNLETVNGFYTGNIVPPQTIGKGKAEAVKRWLSEHNYYDYDRCFAYGDHISDLPMLSLVGHPVVVKGNSDFEIYAKIKGWKVLGN